MNSAARPFRVIASIAAIVMLTACTSSVPMASNTEDAEGKQFLAPAPGQAALYLYRGPAGLGGGEVVFTPAVGPRVLGGLAPLTWMRVDLDAGRHDVRCLGGENQRNLILNLVQGEARFIELEPGTGWVNYRCFLIEVDQKKGRAAILAGSRAQDIR